MQALRRVPSADPGVLMDAGLAVAGVALTALAAWAPSGLTGTAIAGPAWLLALLPLFMGAPLLLRRRAPLLMWTAIWAVIVLQYVITRHPPRGRQLLAGRARQPAPLGGGPGRQRRSDSDCPRGPVRHPAPGLLARRRVRPGPQTVDGASPAERGA
jgi:hypothetical protein